MQPEMVQAVLRDGMAQAVLRDGMAQAVLREGMDQAALPGAMALFGVARPSGAWNSQRYRALGLSAVMFPRVWPVQWSSMPHLCVGLDPCSGL